MLYLISESALWECTLKISVFADAGVSCIIFFIQLLTGQGGIYEEILNIFSVFAKLTCPFRIDQKITINRPAVGQTEENMNQQKSAYQFITKVLVIVMIFQGMPLWELSNAYKWEFQPEKFQKILDVLSVFGPSEARANTLISLTGRAKGTKCQIVWNHIGVPSYEVLRSEEGASQGFEVIGTTDSTYSTFIDDNVVLKTDYWYRVRAEADGETVLSGPVHIYSLGMVRNYPPVFTSEPVTTGQETAVYQYDAEASDREGEALTYILDQSPAGMVIDAATGLITWMPGGGQSCFHYVAVRAMDPLRASATQFFQITVIPESNQSPMAVPGGPYTGTSDEAVTFDGTGSVDPDGDTITDYRWVFGDGNETHGAQAVHTYAAAGVYTVTLYVTDEYGATGHAETTAEISAPLSVSISAAPSTVEKGESAVLTWTSAGPTAHLLTTG
ncbi:MAG: PKD domain-containing protein [Desulfobacteraceae bacterium]|nr:PKD domain-containing protein [Desulfobacteraceae bacterium]